MAATSSKRIATVAAAVTIASGLLASSSQASSRRTDSQACVCAYAAICPGEEDLCDYPYKLTCSFCTMEECEDTWAYSCCLIDS